MVFKPGTQGRAECAACKAAGLPPDKYIAIGRVFKNPQGQPVIVHQCPTTREGEVLFATPITEE